MAGIYIHIPFCKQACHYCNFHFSTSLVLKEKMLDAICDEIVIRKNYLADKEIETIYFGGGTPSVLEVQEIKRIIDTIENNYKTNTKEFTLEANPDDLTKEKLIDLRSIGVNRLSIGVQSFFDADLKWMNRVHDAKQAITCIENALAAGFENLSVDLIYGIPNQSDDKWKYNIQKLFDYNIPHISCYALTVEPKTALQYMIEKDKTQAPDETIAAKHFEILVDMLKENNYEHYEISNFAKNKKYAMHNSSYWKGAYYSGIGPSAHSFNGVSRQWNVANNALYIQNMKDEIIPFEIEYLTEVQKANEKIMTSLRTMWGLNLEEFKNAFDENNLKQLLVEAKYDLQKENLKLENDILYIPAKAKFFADGIISDLFFTEETFIK